MVGSTALAQTTATVSRAGSDIYFETHREGPPILLLHGGLGHSGGFDGLRDHLVVSGYQVVLLDTRGMGRSPLGDIALSYAAQEDDAHAVLDALGIETCPVIGFSDGGITGYRMAARPSPRVSKLVTIGARWSAENGRGMWDTFDTWNRESLGSGGFSFIVDDYNRLNPDGDFDRMVAQAAAMLKDSSADGHPEGRIGEITIPVLVTVGTTIHSFQWRMRTKHGGKWRLRSSSLYRVRRIRHIGNAPMFFYPR
ncbi:alpha/beta fold hydrolase [Cognatiyoonia sp. IB215446]|uniref:alpha/beta fold hydrolase n=1 Tax=Cognatiyoonia sp. IB215446 TaxID=3097355 RepID=UPI002A16E2D0|nr:alpha/beta fold hydrolase [Cognatiyoonia sp. IB215446]MDX8349108.1 alpha/beta fold hydrolase [Cognatiyoonia sp. IB215446]